MEWLSGINQYSGALTFVVTFVYAITTCFILKANKKSADATREQLAESQKQYDETKRLEHRPYFSFVLLDNCFDDVNKVIEIDLCQKHTEKIETETYLLQIQNIGIGAAKGIELRCENGLELFSIDPFPFETALPHEKWIMYINICLPSLDGEQSRKIAVSLHFEYSDLLENKYAQVFALQFMQFPGKLQIIDQTTSAPIII